MKICVINEAFGINDDVVKETINALLDTETNSIFNLIKEDLLKEGRPEILFCSSLDSYETSELNKLPKSQKLVLYVTEQYILKDFADYLTNTENADSISLIWSISPTKDGRRGVEYAVESWAKYKPHAGSEKPSIMDVIKGAVEMAALTQDVPEVIYHLVANKQFCPSFDIKTQ